MKKELLVRYKYLRYWIFGIIFWIFWMTNYLLDRLLAPGNVIPNYNTTWNFYLAIIVIPYLSGLSMSYLYVKLFNFKFLWTVKNQLKFWIFGIINLVTWYVFVFILISFIPNWGSNTYTPIIFFATLPSFIGGLLVNYVMDKWF